MGAMPLQCQLQGQGLHHALGGRAAFDVPCNHRVTFDARGALATAAQWKCSGRAMAAPIANWSFEAAPRAFWMVGWLPRGIKKCNTGQAVSDRMLLL